MVASGANHALTPSEVQGLRPVFHGASYALFQLESPLPAVEAALRLAREEAVKTILDPAPSQKAAVPLLGLVDLLTPNEGEACLLLDRPPSRVTAAEAPELARALFALGARAVVLKLGEQGAFYCDSTAAFLSPGLNKRTDRWGGSVANRAAFPRLMVRAVRDAVGPDMAVIAKLNMADAFPGGIWLDQSLEVARLLAKDVLRSAGLERVTDPARRECFGDHDGAVADTKVMQAAYVDTASGRLIQQGRVRLRDEGDEE